MENALSWVQGLVALIPVAGVALAIGRWVGERAHIRPYDPEDYLKRSLRYLDIERGMVELEAAARKFRPDLIVGINRGGAIVGGLLAKRLRLPGVVLIDVPDGAEEPALAGSHWNALEGEEYPPSGGVRWLRRDPERVLVVDDGAHTGTHMSRAKLCLAHTFPEAEVKGAVMLYNEHVSVAPEPAQCPIDIWAYKTRSSEVGLPWYPG